MKNRIQNILIETMDFNDRPNINDAFWKWFGDSKVIDQSGHPLMVYRGDRPNKTLFTGREDKSNYIQSNVFFTNKPNIGRFYTAHRTNYMRDPDSIDESEGLYRVYLSIKNPLVIDAKGEDWSEIPFNGGTIQIDDLAATARKKGYDGLIVQDVWDQAGDGDQYVAFKPTQIKSVFNQGTWNLNNPDIMK
jgi:hypothetical protein